LSEAVEQAGDTARQGLDDLRSFAREEADTLARGTYGLPELATAPVRLFEILVTNAVRAASTTSDNLALLSLSGRFGSAEAKRAVRVEVGTAAATHGVTLQVSELVGQLTGFRIPSTRIHVDTRTVAADGIAVLTVDCVAAPADIYVGTLTVAGPGKPVSIGIRVAIDEIGVPVT
jgi:hypothetical protein